MTEHWRAALNKFLIPICLAAILFCGECVAGGVVGFLMPSSGLGDQSFNDMTYAGLVRARNDFKFELIREKAYDNTEESRVASLEKLLRRGATVVVANGWEYRTVIRESSLKNPQVKYILNDMPVKAGKNLVSTVYGQHEGAFLAGALAGWMTRSGKVGFIGGEKMPVIQAFLKGYEEGALHGKGDVDLSARFLGDSDDPRSGFDNPALAYQKAKEMYENGVYIILTVAGRSGNGVIRAATEEKQFVIGVDADQDHMARGYVLTSVMKRLDHTTYMELAAIMAGEFKPGIHHYGLREGGVALSPMKYTRDIIGPAIMGRLRELEGSIIEGKIVVTDLLAADR